MANDSEYQPNWRNFGENDTVIAQNPFDEKIEWEVADDNGVKHKYTIDPHSKAELPGGRIATLGVKKIVDRLILEDNNDVLMWNLEERQKYEEGPKANVILRVKSTTPVTKKGEAPQTINLSQEQNQEKKQEKKEAPKPEPEFADLVPSDDVAKALEGQPKTSEVKSNG